MQTKLGIYLSLSALALTATTACTQPASEPTSATEAESAQTEAGATETGDAEAGSATETGSQADECAFGDASSVYATLLLDAWPPTATPQAEERFDFDVPCTVLAVDETDEAFETQLDCLYQEAQRGATITGPLELGVPTWAIGDAVQLAHFSVPLDAFASYDYSTRFALRTPDGGLLLGADSSTDFSESLFAPLGVSRYTTDCEVDDIGENQQEYGFTFMASDGTSVDIRNAHMGDLTDPEHGSFTISVSAAFSSCCHEIDIFSVTAQLQ